MPDARIGPYLRALRAALRALAPDADAFPVAEADHHLAALDPHLSGPVLLPARLDEHTGLPALEWLDRARAEQVVLPTIDMPSPARIERVAAADPALAERWFARQRLARWLSQAPLMPELRVRGVIVRRSGQSVDTVRVSVDRRRAGAGWTRLRLDIRHAAQASSSLRARGETVDVLPGFADWLGRHAFSPLSAIYLLLTGTFGLSVQRLSRTTVGPFWFPGGPAPAPAVEGTENALVLHLTTHVIGEDVRANAQHDPLAPPTQAPDLPPALGHYRARRFAVSPHAVAPLSAWCTSRVGLADVVPILT